MIRKFTSEKQKIGELGEDIACKFLMKHKFEILERNYTKKWGEIDIVAQKESILYFIEVKSVSRNLEELKDDAVDLNSYRPEENMHPQKLRRLSRVVQTYLISKKLGNIKWQIDLFVVYIDINKRLARVKPIKNLIL